MSADRDQRLDMVRGYAMITIALNHVSLIAFGVEWPFVPTLTQFGYSSAAEIFVALSAYIVGMIFMHRPNLGARCWKRAAQVYAYNIACFLLVIPILYMAGSDFQLATHTAYIFRDPPAAIWQALGMLRQPMFLDVLPTYVVLLILTPPLAWLMRKSAAFAVALSLVLYAAAQLGLGFPLAGVPGLDADGVFVDLQAWQLLYVLGILAGWSRVHVPVFAWLAGTPWRPALLLASLAAAGIVFQLDRAGYIDIDGVDKRTLGPVRLAHTLLVLGALASTLVLLERWLDTLPCRAVALIGRQALFCYAVSIIATYAFSATRLALDGSYAGYLVSQAAILLTLLGAAYVKEASLSSRPVPLVLARTGRARMSR